MEKERERKDKQGRGERSGSTKLFPFGFWKHLSLRRDEQPQFKKKIEVKDYFTHQLSHLFAKTSQLNIQFPQNTIS